MRVVHIINGLEVGGAEMMLVKLLRATDPTRARSTVVSLTTTGVLGSEVRAAGVDLTALGLRAPGSVPAGLRRLRRLLVEIEPDVVQTWLYKSDLLGGLAVQTLPRRRPALVWGVRQSALDRHRSSRSNRLAAWLSTRLSARWPDAILCNAAEVLADHAAAGYDRGRMLVIHNGFDLREFRPDPEAAAAVRHELGVGGSPLVGLVARVDPQKDHATFLDAAELVLQALPDTRFLLCGLGADATNPLFSRVSPALARALLLLGVRRDVARLTASLDVAVSSSLFGEGMPNAIGEAMACAVPCVVTDVGGSAGLVGDTGRVVPAGRADLLAEALVETLAMAVAERAARGEAARHRIASGYSIEAAAEQYLALYEEVATRVRDRRDR